MTEVAPRSSSLESLTEPLVVALRRCRRETVTPCS
jgi:hypothetical protein